MLRAYAVSAGVVLLLGYALFTIAGPGIAMPVIAASWTATALLFFSLLGRYPLLLAMVVGLGATLSIVALFTLIIEWDARSIWFFHARFILDGAGPVDLLGSERPFSHPYYPKLLPLIAATIAWVSGFWNESLPKLAVPILLSVPLFYLLGAWRGATCRILLLGLIYLVCGKHLWNGYVDAILALTAVAALTAGNRYLDRGGRLDGYAFVAISALLPALKTEGALAFGAICLGLLARVAAAGEWRRLLQTIRQLGVPVLFALAASLGWFLEVRRHAIGVTSMFSGDPLARLLDRFTDGQSLLEIWEAMLLREFRFVWLVAALILFFVGGAVVRRTLIPTLIAALIVIAGLTALYLMTSADLTWHLSTSANRTMVVPVLLLAVGLVPSTDARSILTQWPEGQTEKS